MTHEVPEIPDHVFAPFSVMPNPLRMIGKIPVFSDEHGEYSLIHIKLWHPRTKKTEEIQVKVDADIQAIRNLYELILRPSAEIKSSKNNEGSLGFIVHQRGNNRTVSGENSLPRTLFGKQYHYARHIREDDRDLRKSSFLLKEVADVFKTAGDGAL